MPTRAFWRKSRRHFSVSSMKDRSCALRRTSSITDSNDGTASPAALRSGT
jgi:hypothetical protein